jgi:hypothetical protein
MQSVHLSHNFMSFVILFFPHLTCFYGTIIVGEWVNLNCLNSPMDLFSICKLCKPVYDNLHECVTSSQMSVFGYQVFLQKCHTHI